MKKFCLLQVILLILGGNCFADQESTIPPAIEGAVVELRITIPAKVAKEVKKSKPFIRLAGHQAVCSGVIIDEIGDILTAGHCVDLGRDITIVNKLNEEYSATVVARSGSHDLAMVHIDHLTPTYIHLADSVTRGQAIYVFGSPLGISDILSQGIIARRAGEVDLLDCSVLPGNSGSPVFDTNYRLVGIATAGFTVGFGVTHLNIMQSLDTVRFFIITVLRTRTMVP